MKGIDIKMVKTNIYEARNGVFGFTYEEASEAECKSVRDLLRFCENNRIRFLRCNVFRTLFVDDITSADSVAQSFNYLVMRLIEHCKYYNPDNDVLLYVVDYEFLLTDILKEGAMKAGFERIILNDTSTQVVFIHMGNFAKELKSKIKEE